MDGELQVPSPPEGVHDRGSQARKGETGGEGGARVAADVTGGVVVSGTARITRGEETYVLEENQSTYIPVGVRHRIENPGPVALHIIEVQSGSYLGEDDIVRLEDRYGRQGTNT